MAADIKKMVEKISNLTVLELCKLIKALKDKFGLRTSDEEPEDAKSKKESTPGPADEPEDKKESEPAPDPPSAEVPNAPDEHEDKPNDKKKAGTQKKSSIGAKKTIKVKPVFNHDLTDYDSNWTPTNQKTNNRSSPSPPTPKGENYDLVYAWRYSDNKRHAKIGRSTKHLLHTRMPVTYYPTGDPVLIGIRKCKNPQHAEDMQNHILEGLKRVRRDREWVKRDEVFDKMIEKSFISDPDELKNIFGENIKTDNSAQSKTLLTTSESS